MNKIRISLMLVLAMSFSFMMSACGEEPAKKAEESKPAETTAAPSEEKTEEEATTVAETTTAAETTKETETESETAAESEAKEGEVSLSDWDGVWNNIQGYADDPGLEEAYKEAAEAQGKSVDEVKADMAKRRECEFNGMVVEGNKVKFLDGFEDKGGKVIAENEYEFDQAIKVKHGNHDIEWSVFKAKDADAKFPILFMMPPHGEEVMLHFHLRYGKDVAEIEKMETWPTFVKPDIKIEQIADGIKAHAKKSAKKDEAKLPEPTQEEGVSLEDWAGSWNNIAVYFNRPEQDKAFEDLAAREKVSVEEAKKKLLDRRACEFNGLVIEGQKIKFLDGFEAENGQPVSEEEYEYLHSFKVKHGAHELMWHVFKAKNAEAKYPMLFMMPIHGEESLTHFHMRYGADEQSIFEQTAYPTFIKPSTTTEQLYDEITE